MLGLFFLSSGLSIPLKLSQTKNLLFPIKVKNVTLFFLSFFFLFLNAEPLEMTLNSCSQEEEAARVGGGAGKNSSASAPELPRGPRTLPEICYTLRRRVMDFLEEEHADDELLRNTQAQARLSMGVIEEALRRYRWVPFTGKGEVVDTRGRLGRTTQNWLTFIFFWRFIKQTRGILPII